MGLGHRRLAAALLSSRNSTVLDHERGWTDGLVACGLDPAEQTVLRLEANQAERNRAIIAELLSRGEHDGHDGAGRHAPTAVICWNDLRAHEVLLTAQALGVRVPEHLSVISFDDMIAAYTSPPLCSFDPHIHEVVWRRRCWVRRYGMS